VAIMGAHPPLKTMQHRVWDGTLAFARAIVATPAEKAALWRATGAWAVDMETQPVQRYAQSLNIPFLAVRAISDCSADSLDPALLSLIDTQGRPCVGSALMHFAGHPAKLPAMMRIRRSTNIALSNLAVTLAAIITSGWPEGINDQ
jgi:adenosylhomocysteine nucleosidase